MGSDTYISKTDPITLGNGQYQASKKKNLVRSLSWFDASDTLVSHFLFHGRVQLTFSVLYSSVPGHKLRGWGYLYYSTLIHDSEVPEAINVTHTFEEP